MGGDASSRSRGSARTRLTRPRVATWPTFPSSCWPSSSLPPSSSWRTGWGRPRPAHWSAPLLPTYCVSWQPNNQPYYVPLRVDGRIYAVLPDTGSSNLAIASSACASCDVHPPMPRGALPASVRVRPDPTTSPLAFETAYGTGATVAVTSAVEIVIDEGGMVLPGRGRRLARGDSSGPTTGRAGLIVGQNTSFGFSLFPPKPPVASDRCPPWPLLPQTRATTLLRESSAWPTRVRARALSRTTLA